MDTNLLPIAGALISVRRPYNKLEHSARADDEYYARFGSEGRFYEQISGMLGAAKRWLSRLIADVRQVGAAVATPHRPATRN